MQDKRYKRVAKGSPLTNRRVTYRTVTRECRTCGLRFSFTWKSLINALRKIAEQESDPVKKRLLRGKAEDIEMMIDSGQTFEEVRDRILKIRQKRKIHRRYPY